MLSPRPDNEPSSALATMGLPGLQLCVSVGNTASSAINSLASVLYFSMTEQSKNYNALSSVIEASPNLNDHYGLQTMHSVIAALRFPALAWVRTIAPSAMSVLEPLWHPIQVPTETPRSKQVATSHTRWPKPNSHLNYFVECAAAADVDHVVYVHEMSPMVGSQSWLNMLGRSVPGLLDILATKDVLTEILSPSRKHVLSPQEDGQEPLPQQASPQIPTEIVLRRDVVPTQEQIKASRTAKGGRTWMGLPEVSPQQPSAVQKPLKPASVPSSVKEASLKKKSSFAHPKQLGANDTPPENDGMINIISIPVPMTPSDARRLSTSGRKSPVTLTLNPSEPLPPPAYWLRLTDMVKNTFTFSNVIHSTDPGPLKPTRRHPGSTNAMIELEDETLPPQTILKLRKFKPSIGMNRAASEALAGTAMIDVVVLGMKRPLFSVAAQYIKTKPTQEEFRQKFNVSPSFQFVSCKQNKSNQGDETKAVVYKMRMRGYNGVVIPLKRKDDEAILNVVEMECVHSAMQWDTASMFDVIQKHPLVGMNTTPLHIAVKFSLCPAVRQFCSLYPSWIHAKDSRGHTPLHLALLEWKQIVLSHAVEDKIAFLRSTQAIVECLLGMDGINVYAKDRRGNTPISIAMTFMPTLSKCISETTCNVVQAQHLLSLQLELEQKATNWCCLVDGLSTQVCYNGLGHPVRNITGVNILHQSVMYGHVDMIEVCMEYSARFHTLAFDTRTANKDNILHLCFANKSSYTKSFPYLMQQLSADGLKHLATQVNSIKMTPLHIALRRHRETPELTQYIEMCIESPTFEKIAFLRDCHNDSILDLLLAHKDYQDRYEELVVKYGSAKNVETVMRKSSNAVFTYLLQVNWNRERYVSALHSGLSTGSIPMFMGVISQCVVDGTKSSNVHQMLDDITNILVTALWAHKIAHSDIVTILSRVTCEHELLRWKIHESMAETALKNNALGVVRWLLIDMPEVYTGERATRLLLNVLYTTKWQGDESILCVKELLKLHKPKDFTLADYDNVPLTVRPTQQEGEEMEALLLYIHNNFVIPVTSSLFRHALFLRFASFVVKVISTPASLVCLHSGALLHESVITKCMEVSEVGFFRLARSLSMSISTPSLIKHAAKCSARILSQVLDWSPDPSHITRVLVCAIQFHHVHVVNEILAANNPSLNYLQVARAAIFCSNVRVCREVLGNPTMAPYLVDALFLSVHYARMNAFDVILEHLPVEKIITEHNGKHLAIEACIGRNLAMLTRLIHDGILTTASFTARDEQGLHSIDACYAFSWWEGLEVITPTLELKPGLLVSPELVENGSSLWITTLRYYCRRDLVNPISPLVKWLPQVVLTEEIFQDCAIFNSLNCLKLLLAAKASTTSTHGALDKALQRGTSECILALFESVGLRVNQPDSVGRNVLHLAAARPEEIILLKFVAQFGAQLRGEKDKTGLLPIHYAMALHGSLRAQAFHTRCDVVTSYGPADPTTWRESLKQQMDLYAIKANQYIAQMFDEPQDRLACVNMEETSRKALQTLRENHLAWMKRRTIRDFMAPLERTATVEHQFLHILCHQDAVQRQDEEMAAKALVEMASVVTPSPGNTREGTALSQTQGTDLGETIADSNDPTSPKFGGKSGRQHKFENIRKRQMDAEQKAAEGAKGGLSRLFDIADASATRSLWTGLFLLRKCVEVPKLRSSEFLRPVYTSAVTQRRILQRQQREEELRLTLPAQRALNALSFLFETVPPIFVGLMYLKRAAHMLPVIRPEKVFVSPFKTNDYSLEDPPAVHVNFLRRKRLEVLPPIQENAAFRGLRHLFLVAPLCFNVPPLHPPKEDSKWRGLLYLRIAIREKPKKYSGVHLLMATYDANTHKKRRLQGLELLRNLVPPPPGGGITMTTAVRSKTVGGQGSLDVDDVSMLSLTMSPSMASTLRPLTTSQTMSNALTLTQSKMMMTGTQKMSSQRMLPGSHHLKQYIAATERGGPSPTLIGSHSLKKMISSQMMAVPVIGCLPPVQVTPKSKRAK